jgi:hypothetical protein
MSTLAEIGTRQAALSRRLFTAFGRQIAAGYHVQRLDVVCSCTKNLRLCVLTELSSPIAELAASGCRKGIFVEPDASQTATGLGPAVCDCTFQPDKDV